MTTIDVNSARSTKGKDIEETAFKTNLEAASEVARQLRLRDVGGLVVIDFIDMTNEDNQNKVESAFRKAVYSDRARVQFASISRFGLLEVSRQRLRPSLNESYDIEHVLVRGPRSLGQSILRIVGEDAAKENTGEIHVYVPADVASYLLNEKRYDIISIEKTNNIKVLIIADPYKSRPYYKVVRVKKSEVKQVDSYSLTPNSPEPDTNWRDNKNISTSMKPLVDGVKPPKMPKKRKDGIVKWLKTITGIETENSNAAKKKPKRNIRKKGTSPRKNTNQKKGFQPKKKPNKNFKNDKKEVKKPQSKSSPKTNARKPVNKKASDVNKKASDVNKKSSDVKNTQKPPVKNKPKAPTEKPKTSSGIKEIVKEKKIKKELPLRAKNDPRQKN